MSPITDMRDQQVKVLLPRVQLYASGTSELFYRLNYLANEEAKFHIDI